ncbi:MAG: hypothetical protein Q9192_004433, partial [Flavoplaca navasiana]
LVELAASLLAQSRNRASSLKAEEEIARTYVCAHIACDRLKQSIGLPKIHYRPPCPPKVYEKLYRQFDSALTTGARRSSRGTKPLGAINPAEVSATTLRKKSAKTFASTPSQAVRKRKREITISDQEPAWVIKDIRRLCKQLGAPAATPHVFAGVSSILTFPAPNQDAMTEKDLERLRSLSIEPLIVGVYTLVRTRLSGVEMDPSTFLEQSATALSILSQLRSEGGTSTIIDPKSVIEWMQEIKRGCWTDLDWLKNIEEGNGLGFDGAESTHLEDSDAGISDEGEPAIPGSHKSRRHEAEKPYLQPGLNTMMQARVDYLSDEKRADYRVWKKGILARIDRIEKAELAREHAL